jgi:predicted DNA-binding transcriptional regulator AlpA
MAAQPNQQSDLLDAKTLARLQREVLAEIRQLRKELRAPRRRLLTVEEAAYYVGLSPKTIRNMIGPKAPRTFPVKPVRMGGKVLFKIEALDQMIEEMAAGADNEK